VIAYFAEERSHVNIRIPFPISWLHRHHILPFSNVHQEVDIPHLREKLFRDKSPFFGEQDQFVLVQNILFKIFFFSLLSFFLCVDCELTKAGERSSESW